MAVLEVPIMKLPVCGSTSHTEQTQHASRCLALSLSCPTSDDLLVLRIMSVCQHLSGLVTATASHEQAHADACRLAGNLHAVGYGTQKCYAPFPDLSSNLEASAEDNRYSARALHDAGTLGTYFNQPCESIICMLVTEM